MSIYSDIGYHRIMVFDEVRNSAYANAIKLVVTTDSVVLDLGAGLGVHGLIAANAGAKKVILLDPSRVVEIGSMVADANGVGDRIQAINKQIQETELDEPVDVIVSVFTGNFLFTEDLLPSLIYARDRFLKPGGAMLPEKARAMAALVTAETFFESRIACWSQPTMELGFEAVRKFAANAIQFGTAEQIGAELLTGSLELLELDFMTAQKADCHCKVQFTVETAGTCHGVLGWFDILLGDKWLSTGPEERPTHWMPALLPVDPPIELREGDSVEFELDRPEFGEWTWTITCKEHRQQFSTFKSRPVDLSSMKRQADSYVPGVGSEGELALFVLQKMRQGLSVSEILQAVDMSYQQDRKASSQLHVRIRKLIAQWGDSEA